MSVSWRVPAPSPPDNVTPDQVREYVAVHPGARAVELSGAFLNRRPGHSVEDWRKLHGELEEAGISVYFVPGGACTREIMVSTTAPVQNRPSLQDVESRVEAVTPCGTNIGTAPPVLQSASPGGNAAETVPIEARIAELAGQGLSTRKIAAALEAEGYPVISHLRVSRTLQREAQLPSP